MKTEHLIGWLLVGLMGVGSAGGQEGLYDKVAAASFEVLVEGRLSGSGWFAGEEGWGFTAAHVVAKQGVAVKVRQGGKIWEAEVQALDVLHDAALLRIKGERPVGMGFAKEFPKVGEEIYLFGAPVFRHEVWIPGRVARKEVTYEFLSSEETGIRCFHVAASSPKGTSGGPWVNGDGEVVGLQSGMMVQADVMQGIAFVTPCAGLEALLKSKQSGQTCSLRAAGEELEEQPVEWLAKWPEGQGGVVLKRVAEDGPLGKEGVKDGDVLVSVNGTPLATRNDFHRIVSGLAPELGAVLVLYGGDGETRTLEVVPVVLERGRIGE
ncbi:MAG: S1C family serine protease [Verrucomicrobia bacterium]|nr:S1C family serine protease [Verrucomicrobiota bacterium]